MKLNSIEGFGNVNLVADLRAWFETLPGGQIAVVEGQLLGRFLADLFGFHIVQLGCHHRDNLLDGSRIAHQVRVDLGHTLNVNADMHCIEDALPLAANSIDVVVLPHVLEYALDVHRVLREAERVLVGEGHMVILGFNPWSWCGLWSALAGWQGRMPWHGRFIGAARLKDWLKLLGFDIIHIARGGYRPPVHGHGLNRRLEFMERLGAFCWPPLSNVYLIVARKRVEGLTPLRASWRQRRRLVAGGVVEPTARTGVSIVAGHKCHER